MSSLAPPAPQEVLVCVGATPITGATYLHWNRVRELSERAPGGRRPSSLAPQAARAEVLNFLISADWVLEEAARLHIEISAPRLKRMFDRIVAQQFHGRRELDAFLRSSGETIADILLRLKVNLLSLAVQRHLPAQFVARWRAATVCEPAYAVPDCGLIERGPL